MIHCDGGEFVDSGTKESYLRFRTCGLEIPLAKNKWLLTMSASVHRNANNEVSGHTSFTNKKHRLTLQKKHWRNMGPSM